jgi:hypothetical protein
VTIGHYATRTFVVGALSVSGACGPSFDSTPENDIVAADAAVDGSGDRSDSAPVGRRMAGLDASAARFDADRDGSGARTSDHTMDARVADGSPTQLDGGASMGAGGANGAGGDAGAADRDGAIGSGGTDAGTAGAGGSDADAGRDAASSSSDAGGAGGAGTDAADGASDPDAHAGDAGDAWPSACEGTPTGGVPDSTPYCSNGSAGECAAGEDGARHAPEAALVAEPSAKTVLDEVTGLSWEDHTEAGALPWGSANNRCNDLTTAGFADWRLPTVRDLVSILDYGLDPVSPAIFTAQGSGTFFLTSESPAGAPATVWRVDSGLGIVETLPKIAIINMNSRCVRGAHPPALVDADASACDMSTGLEWQRRAAGPLTWQDALAYCSTFDDGARLPTVKELMSLFDAGRVPHLPPLLASEPAEAYWSSTPARTRTDAAWRVHFDAHAQGVLAAATGETQQTKFVRCVRSWPE